MWFLQTDMLIRMLICCAVMAIAEVIARKYMKQKQIVRFMLILDIILIAYFSKKLAVFYIGYTLVTYLIVLFIKHRKKARKFWFVVCCLACTVPFFYTRATEFFSFLPYGLTMVGIAYNMLKAIDAVFYTYYTDEDIPILTYANFMLFFPVITAGPIFRYRDFNRTFNNPGKLTAETLEYSVKRIIRGLFKKIVVQMCVYYVFNKIAAMDLKCWWCILLAILSYTILYLDMSGYADIAIGMGRIMGIDVPENFKKPLKAASFTQFWRNWHVTLSDWIREHIFVVLNGRKLTKYQGTMIGFFTMLIMSLWHGFSMLFLIDGVVNGIVLGGENLLGYTTVNKRKVKKSYYYYRCALTNMFFALTTLFFTVSPDRIAAVVRGFITF